MPRPGRNGSSPVVLLTNDDGPPSKSSPNIFGFSKYLHERFGWDVRVVVPDCQKSWVGKAYAISDIIHAKYFYPTGPEGLEGEITEIPRPLKEGETAEWILLSGTPATCANIALHNLYPGEIDLVISGPNHGRNSSTAFSLSSGTIGAALAAAMSHPVGPHPEPIPAIAVSYGVITRPVPSRVTELAHEAAADICARLWVTWGHEVVGSSRRRTQLYTVNVPLAEAALKRDRRRTVWANMWRNAYGSLFQQTESDKGDYVPGSDATNRPQESAPSGSTTKLAGPGAVPSQTGTPDPSNPASSAQSTARGPLKFKFAPSMSHLLSPELQSLPLGSDAWAFVLGFSSVVPLRAEFAGMQEGEGWFEDGAGKRISPGQMWET